jgi:oligopeptidase B
VIYAIAHIRGGGDLGKEWHDEGKMMKKKNTFTDFIAAAEHLVKEKYTAQDKLVISGGSAGGLLMGAVSNMRPDLFKAVVSYVPFVDVINTMMDASLPLTVGEYLEWGNPNEKEAYAYMKSYSPYDNLTAKAYPTMLVKTSLNDSQVMYWEPAKYVAKLRTLKTDKNPLLLKINMGAGHGGASGTLRRPARNGVRLRLHLAAVRHHELISLTTLRDSGARPPAVQLNAGGLLLISLIVRKKRRPISAE